MLGQPGDRPLERGAVGRVDCFEQTAGEIKRARRQLFIDRAARRGEREEGLAAVGAVLAPHHELAPFELADRARHLGLVHVAVGTDRLGGHGLELPEGDEDAPFRHVDAVAIDIDAGERLRYEARDHVELVGEEFFELERRGAGVVPGGDVLLGCDHAGHCTALSMPTARMAEVRPVRNAGCGQRRRGRSAQRVHSIATQSPQIALRQVAGPMLPVTSSGSTLRNDAACE